MSKYEKAQRILSEKGISEVTEDIGRTFEVTSPDSGLVYTVHLQANCGCESAKYHKGYCSHIIACMMKVTQGGEPNGE